MQSTYFQNDYMTLSIVQDIVYVYYKNGIKLDLKAAQKVVKDRIQFQDHLSYPLLCDISDVESVDFAALSYLADIGSLLTTAVALVTKNKRHETMGNYFIQVHEPKTLTRIFTNKDQAIHFLNQFKKKNL